MIVGTLEISLRLEGARSLKDKRQILRSLIERIRRDFQVAIAETADNELWGNACIGIACVSNDATHAESILQKVLNVFDEHPELQVDGMRQEILRL